MPVDQYKCPLCDQGLYRHQPVIPIVGHCKRCERPLRLIGDRYVSWPEWLQIKARIVEASPDQKLLQAVEVIR